jgi:hypothetical protein
VVLAGFLLASLAASSVAAGIRTRELPALEGVEASLRSRAGGAVRVHAIVEVARGPSAGASDELRLLHPAGGDLWLASLPASRAVRGELPPGARRVFDLRPEDRVAPELAARLATGSASDRVALRVKVFRDEPFEPVVARLEALGGRILLTAPALGVVDALLDRGVLAELSRRDDIRWIEAAPPPGVAAANSMRLDAEVNAVQAIGITGSGVVIGMWDTGIAEATHPDLAGRLIAGEPGLVVTTHSTHVAGVVAGDGTNSQAQGGTALQWRGVAIDAEVVGYDLFGGIAETDSAIQVHGIDVSTNSWVVPISTVAANCSLYGDYSSDAPEYDDIVRGIYGKKLPVVFAAGNERDDGDCNLAATGGYSSLPPPGTAKNVISVGAHQSDVTHMTPFSSWGPTDDGRMKPDISAPGCQQGGDFGVTSTSLAGSYLSMCGTSMAAPVIAGSIAALLFEWRARFAGEPRPATYKALLGCFAKDRANAGPDYRFGLGAVNLTASVNELRTATTVEAAIDDGFTDAYTFHVPPVAGDTLIVTLAWDDPTAAELASVTLINDLDLELVAPTTGTFQAYVLDPGQPDSLAVRGRNARDNVEQVRVIAPEPGEWIARVVAYAVPAGPQEYSLVGLDLAPPADPAAVVATAASDTTVQVTWIRPGDVDRAGTLVVRSSAPVAWVPQNGLSYTVGAEPAAGVFVVAADDVDHQSTALVDEPLAPGTVHHYALFAYDEVPNYSPGLADTAETSADAVDAPVVAAAHAVPRFSREGAHPTRGTTALRFELPETRRISLDVYDASGRHLVTLLHGERSAGTHRVEWDGRTQQGIAPAGVYFVRFRTDGLTATEKVVRVR